MLSISERIDRVTHVSKDRLVECPDLPKSAKIEVTSKCNFRCSCCAVKSSTRLSGDMDGDFLKRILVELGSNGVEEVGFFLLGEPLLYKDLPLYIKYAKDIAKIPYTFITTNGSLLDGSMSKQLIESGLDSLKFSINAGSRERYREVHGVDCFENVKNNIINFKNLRDSIKSKTPRTCVSSIYNEEYKDELSSLEDNLFPYIDEFYYLPLYSQGGHIHGEGSTVVGNPGRLGNMVKPIPCWSLFNSIKISWDGYLTACCFDHDSRFKVADLKKNTLQESWRSPEFIKLRKEHLNGDFKNSPCKKCLGL